MTDHIIEAETNGAAAKFNVTIDLSPQDCTHMCKELFWKISEVDRLNLVHAYLDSVGKNICTCSGDSKCTSCNPHPDIIS